MVYSSLQARGNGANCGAFDYLTVSVAGLRLRLGRSFFPDPAKGWRDQVKPAVYYGLSMLLRGIIIMGALDTEKDVLVADACMLLLPLMVLDRNLSRHPAVNCGLALVGNSMMHVVLMLLLNGKSPTATG